MDKGFFDKEKKKYIIQGDKVLDLPGPFKVDLPEIYQIEICSVCNFNCVMCPRELYHREKDQKFIDISLIEGMVGRGEFEGSYFVELQLSGEPLLHPDIQDIIEVIKSTGVMVGLSTNGSLLTPDYVVNKLKGLDYITISLDSVTHREEIRHGFNKPFIVWWDHFLKESILMLKYIGAQVDIQFIEIPDHQEQIANFMEIADEILPQVTIRTIPEAYFTLAHKETYPWPDKGMCMNPFSSISIQSQGHAVPCCFCFGDDYIYGDIKTQTLQEIWESDQVKSLRSAHRYVPLANNHLLPEICKRCYLRSPTLLHTNILYKSIRGKKREWST